MAQPGVNDAGRTHREHESLGKQEAPMSPEAACSLHTSWTITAQTASQRLEHQSPGNSLSVRAGVKKQLRFPTDITITTLRPDITLWLATEKCVLVVELTVP